MKALISYFHFNELGLLELMFAFYPIVSGYTSGFILPPSLLWTIIMCLISFTRHRRHIDFRILYVIFGFILLHEIIVLITNDYNQTHLNSIISKTIFMLTILIVSSALNYKKMIGSLYLVGLISAGGIIYHVIILLSGQTITPIALPFLPPPDLSSRLYEDLFRPTSFFWEPASYITYMLVPLFLSIEEQKKVMIGFWLICILLSTSTNGLIMAPAMVVLSVLSVKTSKSYRSILVIVLFMVGYFFFTSYIFEQGIEKATNTDVTTDARLANGPKLVKGMPIEHLITGIPEHDVVHYAQNNDINIIQGLNEKNYYLSDFWYVLITYGIFGLILHLSIYFLFLKRDKTLLPYIIILLLAQFTQSVSFRSMYTFQMCFMLCYIYSRYSHLEKQSKRFVNYKSW